MTVGTNEDNFLARLQSCLVLQKQYRDMVRSLRDSFGVSHSTTHVLNSVTPAASPQKRYNLQISNTLSVNHSSSRLPSQLSTQGNVCTYH